MDKLSRLKNLLEDRDNLTLAYSGGLSSNLLARVLQDMGKEFTALTVDNNMLVSKEEIAEEARKLGIEHSFVKLNLLEEKNFIENTGERCYFCKKGMIEKLREFSRYNNVVDASNATDLVDYRAGVMALMEEGIFMPLVEADLSREEVEELASEYSLEIKPPESCLATRMPVDRWIRGEEVEKVRGIENDISCLGFKLVRGRLHQNLIRLQFLEEEMERALEMKTKIQDIAAKRGVEFAVVDLVPYE